MQSSTASQSCDRGRRSSRTGIGSLPILFRFSLPILAASRTGIGSLPILENLGNAPEPVMERRILVGAAEPVLDMQQYRFWHITAIGKKITSNGSLPLWVVTYTADAPRHGWLAEAIQQYSAIQRYTALHSYTAIRPIQYTALDYTLPLCSKAAYLTALRCSLCELFGCVFLCTVRTHTVCLGATQP